MAATFSHVAFLLIAGVLAAGTATPPEAPERPWVGVQLGEVPELLGVHLRLGRPALLVTNVVADSPARQAGIKRYDVISELDGEPAPAGVSAFIEQVGRMPPGRAITLTVISEGQPKQVRLTLGSRPDGEIKWVYEPHDCGPRDVVEMIAPKIYELDKDGLLERSLKDLPQDLRDRIRNLPDHKERWVQELLRHSGARLEITRLSDGKRLHVSELADGRIEVERSGDGQSQSVLKAYGSMEELAKEDPDAHRLLHDAKEGRQAEGADATWRWNFEFDMKDKDVRRLQEEVEEIKKFWDANRGNFELLRKELPKLLESDLKDLEALNFDRQKWLSDPERTLREAKERLDKLRSKLKGEGSSAASPSTRPAARRTQFDLQPDGSIKVQTTSESGQSLVFSVKDEAELAAKYPKLHEEYEALKGSLK